MVLPTDYQSPDKTLCLPSKCLLCNGIKRLKRTSKTDEDLRAGVGRAVKSLGYTDTKISANISGQTNGILHLDVAVQRCVRSEERRVGKECRL